MAEENTTEELTLGGKRVRLSFNPNANQEVEEIKKQAANLIDFVEMLKPRDPRLAALAQTAFEEGAMWAVKLATTEPLPEPKLPGE